MRPRVRPIVGINKLDVRQGRTAYASGTLRCKELGVRTSHREAGGAFLVVGGLVVADTHRFLYGPRAHRALLPLRRRLGCWAWCSGGVACGLGARRFVYAPVLDLARFAAVRHSTAPTAALEAASRGSTAFTRLGDQCGRLLLHVSWWVPATEYTPHPVICV